MKGATKDRAGRFLQNRSELKGALAKRATAYEFDPALGAVSE